MKYVWCVILAGICLWGALFGTAAEDVAELLPVQVLVIGRQQGAVCVKTDNGVSGSGATLEAAMKRAEHNAAGHLFLETADHVVLVQPDAALLCQLAEQTRLRPGTKLYRAEREQSAEALPAYLSAHGNGVRLVAWKAERLRGNSIRLPDMNARPEGKLEDEKKNADASA